MKVTALLIAAALALLPSSGGSVSVAYAGSLVATMEGPIAGGLLRQTGVHFLGEAKGSKALANLIASGLRVPDVFISADPALIDGLMGPKHGNLVDSYTIFGSARIVIGYASQSPYRAFFEQTARGRRSILSVLAMPGVRVGRTDPLLDPKGARTIRAISLLGRHDREPGLAREVLAKTRAFPEEDLAVRVGSDELDAGFFYSTETKTNGLRVVELPADSNLSRQIEFAVAQLHEAPHPQAARVFMNFLLRGDGKQILTRGGVRFFRHPRVVHEKTTPQT